MVKYIGGSAVYTPFSLLEINTLKKKNTTFEKPTFPKAIGLWKASFLLLSPWKCDECVTRQWIQFEKKLNKVLGFPEHLGVTTVPSQVKKLKM